MLFKYLFNSLLEMKNWTLNLDRLGRNTNLYVHQIILFRLLYRARSNALIR
jgi:hypothetical protein